MPLSPISSFLEYAIDEDFLCVLVFFSNPLSLCKMALGRLETLLLVDSNDSPLNFGLTAQNSPLKVATRSSRTPEIHGAETLALQHACSNTRPPPESPFLTY